MKHTTRLKTWIANMQKQGADIATLTASQYAWHLMLLGGGREVDHVVEHAEFQKEIGKALRFGLDDGCSDTDRTNAIAKEFNEAVALYWMVEATDGFYVMPEKEALQIQEEKIQRVERGLRYSEEKI